MEILVIDWSLKINKKCNNYYYLSNLIYRLNFVITRKIVNDNHYVQ